jgi:hypothetical protein
MRTTSQSPAAAPLQAPAGTVSSASPFVAARDVLTLASEFFSIHG